MADTNATASEPFALSDATGSAHRDPGERGTLDIKTKALTRIAERAATEVDGTVRSSSTLQRATGRGYPNASVRVDRNRAWIDLDVATTWPAPLSQIAKTARDTVAARTTELTGLDVRRVDVTVHVIAEPDDAPTTARRVQ